MAVFVGAAIAATFTTRASLTPLDTNMGTPITRVYEGARAVDGVVVARLESVLRERARENALELAAQRARVRRLERERRARLAAASVRTAVTVTHTTPISAPTTSKPTITPHPSTQRFGSWIRRARIELE